MQRALGGRQEGEDPKKNQRIAFAARPLAALEQPRTFGCRRGASMGPQRFGRGARA